MANEGIQKYPHPKGPSPSYLEPTKSQMLNINMGMQAMEGKTLAVVYSTNHGSCSFRISSAFDMISPQVRSLCVVCQALFAYFVQALFAYFVQALFGYFVKDMLAYLVKEIYEYYVERSLEN